jgi:hypothetical protein
MTRSPSARQPLLLLAGVAAAALYVSIVQIAAEMTPGYSHIAQPVSSLYQSGAAIGAPVAAAFAVYNMLVGVFGLALVRLAQARAERSRAGVAAGAGIMLCALAGAVDAIFPQDPIGAALTTPGTLHIAFAGIASLLTVASLALAAWWLLGRHELRPLAWYSVASLVVILASGPATAAATASNSAYMGLLERVTILTFTLWMAIASVVLARAESRAAAGVRPA